MSAYAYDATVIVSDNSEICAKFNQDKSVGL